MATVVLNSVNEGFCAMYAFLRVKSGVFTGVGSSYTLTGDCDCFQLIGLNLAPLLEPVEAVFGGWQSFNAARPCLGGGAFGQLVALALAGSPLSHCIVCRRCRWWLKLI